jgi:hypothetical protein
MMAGNLCPNSVMLNRHGRLKLVSSLSSPRELHKTSCKDLVLRSPEEMDSEHGMFIQGVNSAADSYRLGLVLLEVASLIPSANLYDQARLTFDRDRFLMRLGHVQSQYSPSLQELIRRLTLPGPADRLKLSQLMALLSPHEAEIRGLREFVLPVSRLRQLEGSTARPPPQPRPPKGIFSTLKK